MDQFLPSSMDDWSFSGPVRVYTGEEIFDYMDGAGEVYRAYTFQKLVVQRYSSPGEDEILVELFDMGSSGSAFGVFTYMLGRGPAVEIGQDGEYKSGLLCFWRGKYFVCVKTDSENDRSKNAVLAIGKHISSAVAEDGERPAVLKLLPEKEFLETSLRYFYTSEILNSHFFVSRGNIFGLNERTQGVLVRMADDKSQLLVLEYPDPVSAEKAVRNFMAHYMPDAKEQGIVQTENKKWTACTRKGVYILTVFDSPAPVKAKNTLELIERRLQ